MRCPSSILAFVLAASSPAYANKPLPKGLTISFKDGVLYAARDGLVVPLLDDETALQAAVGDFNGAELRDDGESIVVHASTCGGDYIAVRMVTVDARFENLRGMRAHLEKKYDDAIVHFSAAVAGDNQNVYVTNLLSAQSLGKHFDDADRTIAKYGPRSRAWFAWRLAVDPDLAALRGRASAKPYVGATTTKLAVAALGRDDVAVSPLGFVATHEWLAWGGPGAPDAYDLALYTLGGADDPLRLPAIPLALTCGGMGQSCTKAEDAKRAASMHKLDGVLSGLGFEKRATTWVDVLGNDAKVVTSPDKGTTVTIGDAGVTVKRGKTSVDVAIDGRLLRIGFAGDLVVIRIREGFVPCDGDAQRSYSKIVQLK